MISAGLEAGPGPYGSSETRVQSDPEKSRGKVMWGAQVIHSEKEARVWGGGQWSRSRQASYRWKVSYLTPRGIC